MSSSGPPQNCLSGFPCLTFVEARGADPRTVRTTTRAPPIPRPRCQTTRPALVRAPRPAARPNSLWRSRRRRFHPAAQYGRRALSPYRRRPSKRRTSGRPSSSPTRTLPAGTSSSPRDSPCKRCGASSPPGGRRPSRRGWSPIPPTRAADAVGDPSEPRHRSWPLLQRPLVRPAFAVLRCPYATELAPCGTPVPSRVDLTAVVDAALAYVLPVAGE